MFVLSQPTAVKNNTANPIFDTAPLIEAVAKVFSFFLCPHFRNELESKPVITLCKPCNKSRILEMLFSHWNYNYSCGLKSRVQGKMTYVT